MMSMKQKLNSIIHHLAHCMPSSEINVDDKRNTFSQKNDYGVTKTKMAKQK